MATPVTEFADTLHQELTTGEVRHVAFTGAAQWQAGLNDPLVRTQRTHGATCAAWWERRKEDARRNAVDAAPVAEVAKGPQMPPKAIPEPVPSVGGSLARQQLELF
jgi:hypothetical protein